MECTVGDAFATAEMKRLSDRHFCSPEKQKGAEDAENHSNGIVQIENLAYKGFIEGTQIGMLEARMNNPPIASNTSGYNGVYKNVNGMWTAQITF